MRYINSMRFIKEDKKCVFFAIHIRNEKFGCDKHSLFYT
jgi:hypothetical protein